MILVILAILAVAFFGVMIFMQRGATRNVLVTITGALLAVSVVIVAMTKANGFGFEKTTQRSTIAFDSATKVTKSGKGTSFTVTVKDPAGSKTKYVNDGAANTVNLHKGYAAGLTRSVTTQKAKNGFFKFLYMFTGMDGKVTATSTDISIPKWTNK